MLVIDDNVTVQDILSRLPFSLGHNSTITGNGFVDETLFLISPNDLVITNLQMPLMNVLELSRVFKERSQRPLQSQ